MIISRQKTVSWKIVTTEISLHKKVEEILDLSGVEDQQTVKVVENTLKRKESHQVKNTTNIVLEVDIDEVVRKNQKSHILCDAVENKVYGKEKVKVVVEDVCPSRHQQEF